MTRTFIKGASYAWRVCAAASRNPSGAWVAARMAWWVTALSLLVKVAPLSRAVELTSAAVRVPSPAGGGEATSPERLARTLDAVLSVDFLWLTPTCWKRAIVLRRFLALSGVDSRIVFGVRKGDAGQIDGHAWLTTLTTIEKGDGEPLLEPTPLAQYSTAYVFGSGNASHTGHAGGRRIQEL